MTFRDEFLEKLANGLVEGFCETISGRVIGGRGHTLDSELSAEPLKSLTDKLGSIVMDNSPKYTKTVDDVMFNEFGHIR